MWILIIYYSKEFLVFCFCLTFQLGFTTNSEAEWHGNCILQLSSAHLHHIRKLLGLLEETLALRWTIQTWRSYTSGVYCVKLSINRHQSSKSIQKPIWSSSNPPDRKSCSPCQFQYNRLCTTCLRKPLEMPSSCSSSWSRSTAPSASGYMPTSQRSDTNRWLIALQQLEFTAAHGDPEL